MSFPFLQKSISALKMALGEFVLPSVLPHDVDALKTLILAQQNAHAAVVQSATKPCTRRLRPTNAIAAPLSRSPKCPHAAKRSAHSPGAFAAARTCCGSSQEF